MGDVISRAPLVSTTVPLPKLLPESLAAEAFVLTICHVFFFSALIVL